MFEPAAPAHPAPSLSLEHKLAHLRALLLEYGSVCVGYSGGVDSVFLATLAVQVLGPRNVLAVTGRSASVPEAQLISAREYARQSGLPHLEIPTHELSDPRYVANPANRCYYCKQELWRVLTAVAAQRGLAAVVDGSNADDAADYRPGYAAGREFGVHSPLQQAGLCKQEIRDASRALGLPTWNQPAAPCLASRLPYGLSVTPARLRQVEQAEEAIRRLGFREFRVRHHGPVARLEFAGVELPRVWRQRAEVCLAVYGAGFQRVLLDVEGYRRGALNENLNLAAPGMSP